MYSHKERMDAVQCLIQNRFNYTTTIMELGYPTSTQALRNWYNEYKVNGELHHKDDTQRKYSKEERLAVIQYYLENGQNIKKTIRDLGYPSRQALRQWLKEEVPEDYHPCQRNHANVYFSQSQKEQAVIDFCAKVGSGKEIAAKYGTSRESLYVWKKKLLPKEIPKQMAKKKEPTTREEAEAMIAELKAEVAQLTEQTEDLKKQVYRLDLEKSVLEKAAEVIKKGRGISIQTLTNREKAVVINALRERFPLKDLLQSLQIAKSSYCYQVIAMNTDRYSAMRETVRTVFEESKERYGYRRVHAVIKSGGKRYLRKLFVA